MAFEGKMATGDVVYLGFGKITTEGLRTSWDKGRVVLTPYGEQRWLVLAKVGLKVGVEGYVGAVVEDEVILHLGTSW